MIATQSARDDAFEPMSTLVNLVVPKSGSTDEQCEDASAWSHDSVGGLIRLAISDGATDSIFAGRWARLLTRHYIESPPGPKGFDSAWLGPIRQEFSERLAVETLPWFAMEKATRGAFATLLGLEVDLRKRRYRAVGFGDACLVVVTRGTIRIFPPAFKSADAFSNRPELLGTVANPPKRTKWTGHSKFDPKDSTFFLMTDALAAWFARELSENAQPAVDQLEAPTDSDDLAALVMAAREDKSMRDDDVTLLRLRLG